ncbi:hypothetical protein [Natrialba asiatica]|uniref:hypothetical protein n=1 Tax=Natrialba asiatica TaxID=64602 RepID=UPI0009FE3449|nr:hypothetical protein [Natrialba asiatica]
MPWKRDTDDYSDKPYGNPRRAANIRWESRSRRTLRRTREGLGSVFRLLTWPFRAVTSLITVYTGRGR